MKGIQKKLRNTNGDRLLRICIFFFLSFCLSTQLSLAQTPDSASSVVSADSASASDGFAKKENTAKIFDEAREIAAKSRRDQILQYVIMVVGFSIVIGIAWFTTVLARKRKKKEDEIRAIRMQKMKNKLHPPRR